MRYSKGMDAAALDLARSIVDQHVHAFRKSGRFQRIALPGTPKKLAVNPSPQNSDGRLLCYHCSRVLCLDRFADNQCSGEYAPQHPRAIRRFCIKCGIESRIFKPGSVSRISRWDFHFCKACTSLVCGKFCKGCNKCGSCLGFFEHDRLSSKCPGCCKKTLRFQTYRAAGSNLEQIFESVFEARLIINLLTYSRNQDWKQKAEEFHLATKFRSMDFVFHHGQLELVFFSRSIRNQPTSTEVKWQPAIIHHQSASDSCVLFLDPRLNLVESRSARRLEYLFFPNFIYSFFMASRFSYLLGPFSNIDQSLNSSLM